VSGTEEARRESGLGDPPCSLNSWMAYFVLGMRCRAFIRGLFPICLPLVSGEGSDFSASIDCPATQMCPWDKVGM
jgi:hypothetical protein